MSKLVSTGITELTQPINAIFVEPSTPIGVPVLSAN